MANNQTRIDGRHGRSEFAVTHHETDAPLIPIAQIERLHNFAPERVQWVFDQTQIEAENRRAFDSLNATRVFVERMAGMLIAAGVCCVALYAAYLTAMAGHEVASVAIGSTAAVGLAGAFLTNRRK